MGSPLRSVRLPFWSRSVSDERQHAIATLRSLGPTSVPGLAAALSWSVPRTQKVLGELARRGPPGLVYDVRSGTIRWGPATPPSAAPPSRTPSELRALGGTNSPPRTGLSPSPDASALGRSVTVPPGAFRSTVVPPAPSPSIRVARSEPTPRECSRCHTPVVPTDTADEFACPMCGRRVTSAGTWVSPSPGHTATAAGPDPRIQQLIADWATGRPSPCPQCHQPIRHTTNGEFHCGSCGTRIAYDPPASSTAPVIPSGPAGGPGR
jgi:predicted RNA-binding Zn-ribbon protein involved in translation (DUF1610 family)